MTEKKMLDLFLATTIRLTPHGEEGWLDMFLSNECIKDVKGNRFLKIGNPDGVAFTCHLDTVGESVDVKHIIEGRYVRTDGKTALGADDKAGMTIMLAMIEDKVPGLYCFFVGEECGCIGSSSAADNTELFKDIKMMISLDRKGYSDIITTQSSGVCASKLFADSLSAQMCKQGLFMHAADGVFTDSNEFTHLIPECSNLSVGYFHQHGANEYQDYIFMHRMYKALTEIDYSQIAISRVPVKKLRYDSWWNEKWDDDAFTTIGSKDYKSSLCREYSGSIALPKRWPGEKKLGYLTVIYEDFKGKEMSRSMTMKEFLRDVREEEDCTILSINAFDTVIIDNWLASYALRNDAVFKEIEALWLKGDDYQKIAVADGSGIINSLSIDDGPNDSSYYGINKYEDVVKDMTKSNYQFITVEMEEYVS